MPPALRNLYTWDGKGYGVPNDADGQVLYYRRDILADPKWRTEFKEALGYDLPVPPRTWQQVLDIAKFFNGKDWDASDGRPDHGMVMHLKPGEQGHYHFQSLAAAFALSPGEKAEGGRNAFWFDPENMTPLINSPGHVAALEMLQALERDRAGGAARLAPARSLELLPARQGDLHVLVRRSRRALPGRGIVAASTANAASRSCPAPRATGTAPRGSGSTAAKPQPVGNTTGGSWHGVISRLSKQPEAAYAFLSLMALPAVSSWNAQHGWTGVNPGFTYQFLPPGRHRHGSPTTSRPAGTRPTSRTICGPITRPSPRRRCCPICASAVRPNTGPCSTARSRRRWVGARPPPQALDDAAAAWEKITDRLGREQQLELYRAAIGYQPPPGASG